MFRGYRMNVWRLPDKKVYSFANLFQVVVLASLAVVLVRPFPVWAELHPKNVAFRHVLSDKDIALGTVFETFQDREGFIWFGAENAVVRYDGYSLQPVYLYEGDGDAAERKIVSALDILQDDNGSIWIASSEGLLLYNRQADRLVSVPDHPSLKDAPLSTTYLRALENLQNGTLAVATYSGLYIVNPNTGEGKLYRATDSNGVQYNSIRNLYFDGKNTLWIGTGFGLDRMDIRSEVIEHYKPYSEDPNSVPHNCVTSIIEDESGWLWLGTRSGILYFNPEDGQYQRYLHQASGQDVVSGGDVWSMFEGANGYYWIGTEKGLMEFDPTTKRVVTFRHEPGRESSLSSNVIRNVFKDNNENIWISTFPTGVNYLDRKTRHVSTYTKIAHNDNSLSHDSILSIVEDAAGNLWLGTDGGGLDYFDRAQNKFTHYRHKPMDSSTISSDRILSLILDSKNTLWGGTWGGGVFYMDLENREVERLPGHKEAPITPGVSESNFLNNDKVWSILEDRNGEIWMATIRGGLSRYNRHNKIFTHYVHDPNDPGSIPGNHVWTSFEDSLGVFWVGTTSGLAILDRETHTFRTLNQSPEPLNSVVHRSTLAIFEDSQNRLWVGTDTGLHLYHRNTQTFTSYGLKNGFLNDSIRSIVEDSVGRLWLGTNSGVTFFDPDTLKVKNFSREGGKLIGGFNYNASLLSGNEEVVMGGKNGLRIFKTDKIKLNSALDDVTLTEFKIFNEVVPYGERGYPLQEPISLAKHITLKHSDSFFSFEYSTLNYSSAEKNQYAYKLEGFDSKWNYVGSRRNATYTNLDPGRYTFKVKAANEDGVWNKEAKQIDINILPPWWGTWWAYCLYGLVCLALYAYYRRHEYLKRIIEEKNNNLALKRKLSQRITKLLEDERKVIAQEVHDNINSTIIATRMITQSIERLMQVKTVDNQKIVMLAQRADQQLAETYDFFRSLLQKLRPEIIGTLGFDGAIKELVENYNSIHSSCLFDLNISGMQKKISEDAGIGLYRIAQEAITNALKHASPTKITIDLLYTEESLTMSITDNGSGFSLNAKPGLGIEHMRERIQSLDGSLSLGVPRMQGQGGTVVTVFLPLNGLTNVS